MNLNQASNYITTGAGLVAAGRQPEQPVCSYYGNVSNHHQNTAEGAVAGVYGYGDGGGESGRNVSIVEALDGTTMMTTRSRQMPRGGMAMMMMIGLGSATSGSGSGSSNSSISIDGSGSGSSNSSSSSSSNCSNNSGSNSSGSNSSSSRYESQKRRDWNTFGQYLRNHRPPLPLPRCSGAHVLEFLRYLDQFGKTKVHVAGCPYYGQPTPPATCACPLRQAWGSLDALIGRLRAAFEENGGRPESNPFGARAVRLYLRHVRETQAKARGIAYEKKKRKRPPPPPPPPPPPLPSPSPSALVRASDSSGNHFWALPPPPPPPGFSPLPFPTAAAAGMPPRWHHPSPQPAAAASWQPNAPPEGGAASAWPSFHMLAAAHSSGGGNTALPPPPICSGSLDDLSLLETSNYCS